MSRTSRTSAAPTPARRPLRSSSTEFVGETPWAHLDIAGTMQSSADDAWRSKGATGFGARLLIDVARAFQPAK